MTIKDLRDILIHFTDITYQTFMFKSKNIGNVNEPQAIGVGVNIPLLRKQSELLNKMPNKKYLSNNLIVNEENIIITQNVNYIYKLITECFINLRNSFVKILEENNINVNVNTLDQLKKEQKSSNLNKTVSETQKELQEMICTQFVNIKGGLIGMFINFNDINTSQNFISIMQTFIYIFSSYFKSKSFYFVIFRCFCYFYITFLKFICKSFTCNIFNRISCTFDFI